MAQLSIHCRIINQREAAEILPLGRDVYTFVNDTAPAYLILDVKEFNWDGEQPVPYGPDRARALKASFDAKYQSVLLKDDLSVLQSDIISRKLTVMDVMENAKNLTTIPEILALYRYLGIKSVENLLQANWTPASSTTSVSSEPLILPYWAEGDTPDYVDNPSSWQERTHERLFKQIHALRPTAGQRREFIKFLKHYRDTFKDYSIITDEVDALILSQSEANSLIPVLRNCFYSTAKQQQLYTGAEGHTRSHVNDTLFAQFKCVLPVLKKNCGKDNKKLEKMKQWVVLCCTIAPADPKAYKEACSNIYLMCEECIEKGLVEKGSDQEEAFTQISLLLNSD